MTKNYNKVKVTKSALVKDIPPEKLKAVGWHKLQNLLAYHSPHCYTEGKYGLNFNVYFVYDLVICTGYRGLVGEKINENIVDYYERLAMDIYWDSRLSNDSRKAKIEELLKEFCERIS